MYKELLKALIDLDINVDDLLNAADVKRNDLKNGNIKLKDLEKIVHSIECTLELKRA